MFSNYKHVALTSALLGLGFTANAEDTVAQQQMKSNSSMMNKSSCECPCPAKKMDYCKHDCVDRIADNGLYVEADYLFWKATEDGLEYASFVTDDFNQAQVTGGGPSSTQYSHALGLDGEWMSGFRAGFGGLFGSKDQWDWGATWTWFYDHQHSSQGNSTITSLSSFPTSFYQPSWSPALGSMATSAEGHWKMKMNVVDMDFAKWYWISKKISMRPFFGARGAWIHQHYKSSYNTVFSYVNTTGTSGVLTTFAPNNEQSRFKGSNQFNGGGLHGGTDLTFHFDSNWSFYGKVGGSLLYGKFDVQEGIHAFQFDNAYVGTTPILMPFNIHYSKDMWRVRGNVEAFAALQWEMLFSCDSYRLALAAGWELSHWFAQNELSQVLAVLDQSTASLPTTRTYNQNAPAIRQGGDLGMQGLTIKAMFDF